MTDNPEYIGELPPNRGGVTRAVARFDKVVPVDFGPFTVDRPVDHDDRPVVVAPEGP